MALPDHVTISGEIIATGVSWEDYLEHYSAHYCEWIEGTVIKMAPASLPHNELVDYVSIFVGAYFELRPIGQIISSPFVMKMDVIGRSREPDLLIVLKTNPHTLTDTQIDGPADICIEVVSPESGERDHGEKFIEYEKAGVPEYWILDKLRKEARFYHLSESGFYIPQKPDAEGNYRTPALPQFVLHVSTLWQEKLPGPIAIAKAVQSMIGIQEK
jgi:Uma2 family endonuclease